jgi:hypothetical protein
MARRRARPVVALATCAAYPALTADDRLLATHLDAIGVDVSVRTWTDESVWRIPADLVMIRSCWDYHHHLVRFLAWIDEVAAREMRVINPPGVLHWNTRKRYLVELEHAGIATGVPTALIRAATPEDRETQLRRAIASAMFDWSEIVAKPEVSGTAWETCRLRPLTSAADMERLEACVRARDTIVQPFLSEIVSTGELSLIYFGGTFSHAVAKRAAEGDFRVQQEFGGSTASCVPDFDLRLYADSVLQETARLLLIHPRDLAYARVDLVNSAPPRLMELELIEPSLFLGSDALAPARFAGHIASLLPVESI